MAGLVAMISLAVPFIVHGLANDNGYRIGPGDVLKISVYDHPDLATVARVDDHGRIAFPLVGQVEISGQTAASAAQIVAAKLNGDYVVNPQVSIFVEEFRSQKVVIIGENHPRRVDASIVAATNRALGDEVKAGRFRHDLLYRLDVLRIVVPPLRERPEDVGPLALAFWREAMRRTGGEAELSSAHR